MDRWLDRPVLSLLQDHGNSIQSDLFVIYDIWFGPGSFRRDQVESLSGGILWLSAALVFCLSETMIHIFFFSGHIAAVGTVQFVPKIILLNSMDS